MSDGADVLDVPVDIGAGGDRCIDFDDECVDVHCKLTCWLLDPAQGVCPYLTGEIRE